LVTPPASVPCRENEPLSKYTSYRIGGPARYFFLPQKLEDVFQIGAFLKKSKTPFFILGNGSNVLAPDEGFPGAVVCTKEIAPKIEFHGERVRASASTLNARLLRACAEKGLGGLDALAGVPGNLGGAVFMNAGTASGWIDSVIEAVEVVSLSKGLRKIPAEELSYSYREQHFLREGEIIWSATLRLREEEPAQILARLVDSMKKRKAAQPIELPSCGSVFRNPPGQNAWKLIADAGLRGFAKGGARISAKHCNFIVNEGGAKKSDVLFLIETARERVRATSGVVLQPEVVLMEPHFL
jgi:UDP-N-acetylmuramate dehydrogenase